MPQRIGTMTTMSTDNESANTEDRCEIVVPVRVYAKLKAAYNRAVLTGIARKLADEEENNRTDEGMF